MDYCIRKVEFDNIDNAFNMVLNVFMEFNAPDYGEEGVNSFKNGLINNDLFKNRFDTGDQLMFGAYLEGKVIGVIAVSARNHISLLFVDKIYHNKGIATSLFNSLLHELKCRKATKITLNSSPYAVKFYKKLGFIQTDTKQCKNGIIYTPMEYFI